MPKPLTRRLLETRMAGKKIRCRECREYILKDSPYTYCTIIGFWGSHHKECFDKVSVSLETENTGELSANSSRRAFQQGISKRIVVLKATNEGR